MSSSIASHIEQIEKLRFLNLRKGQIATAKRVLRIDDRQYLIELHNGQFASTANNLGGNNCLIGFGTTEPSKQVLHGLVKMGILTKKEVDEHIKRQTEFSKKHSKKYAVQSLQRACEELGIPMPKVPE